MQRQRDFYEAPACSQSADIRRAAVDNNKQGPTDMPGLVLDF